MIINWIKKRFGYHVCEEFTRWKTIKNQLSRPIRIDEGIITDQKEISYTRRYQERECTICGKIHQRKVKYI